MKKIVQQEKFKSGFVAVLGKPNVGKSSLINALVREKVAIVSPKPQTTRNKILGILNGENFQIVFNDTPGIITPKNKLNEIMMKDVKMGSEGVDTIMFVITAEHMPSENEIELISKYSKNNNLVLVVNKMDLVNYEKVFPILDRLNRIDNIKEIVPVSAKTNKNLQELISVLLKYIPFGDPFYDREDYTDKPVRFIVSELIREKALWLLNDEIPHGINVEVVKFEESKNIIDISAEITCEKQSHKSIIIGEKGNKLKEIGSKARKDIEKLVSKKVYLEIFVKVKEGWRDNKSLLDGFGYSDKK